MYDKTVTYEELKQLLKKNVADCMSAINNVVYEPKGISNFEGLCLWSLSDFYKPDIIIESGVSRARSTEILGEIANHFGIEKVYAFEKSSDHEAYVRDKLSKYPNVVYEIADSSEKILSLANSIKNKRVGIFVDGPKKGSAYARLMSCISDLSQVQYIMSHDCYVDSPTKNAFSKGYKKHFSDRFDIMFTDTDANPLPGINDRLIKQVKDSNPEKLAFLTKNCFKVGIMTKKEL